MTICLCEWFVIGNPVRIRSNSHYCVKGSSLLSQIATHTIGIRFSGKWRKTAMKWDRKCCSCFAVFIKLLFAQKKELF